LFQRDALQEVTSAHAKGFNALERGRFNVMQAGTAMLEGEFHLG
jgi:hypothetical protein